MNDSEQNLYPADAIRIVGLNYVSFYLKQFEEAVAFYTRIFGPAEYVENEGAIQGWRMGSTYLTFFPSRHGPDKEGDPRNAEFAIQVSAPAEVDLLYQAFIDAGAKSGDAPVDTTMYEPMRFAYVDDPFGIRIDIYCPADSV
jgi:catechol 2,3-dioxygenase-like lactoylglutathione lyase family enzyme